MCEKLKKKLKSATATFRPFYFMMAGRTKEVT
jgi:hypothetical protein